MPHANNQPLDRKELQVFVQVNTSGEASKSGHDAATAMEVARYIVKSCSRLRLRGLMTIGPTDGSDPSPFFRSLKEAKKAIEDETHEDLELSMGMSGDWEIAIAEGSTNIRVGSSIFGAR